MPPGLCVKQGGIGHEAHDDFCEFLKVMHRDGSDLRERVFGEGFGAKAWELKV